MNSTRRGLRSLRAHLPPFDGRFHERDGRFWPIAGAASVFASCADWPAPADYALAFRGGLAPVCFERQLPVKRARGAPIDRSALYDARIVRGAVPTRERDWHDFLNALVWATFPRAKLALHTRQHALIEAWIPPGATTLPNARTREQDAFAVLDEGGIVLLRAGDRELPVPFGHAFFEGLVLGSSPMVTRALPVDVPALPSGPREAIALAEDALVARIAASLSPEQLPRYVLRSADCPWG